MLEYVSEWTFAQTAFTLSGILLLAIPLTVFYFRVLERKLTFKKAAAAPLGR